MAMGFGATDGIANTDSLVPNISNYGVERTYAFRFKHNSNGGGGVGRIFDSTSSFEAILIASNAIQYIRTWNGTSYAWIVQNSLTIGITYSFVISYSTAAATNNPIIYINGVLATLTNPSARSGTASSGTPNYKIGNRSLDNVRVWDGWISSFAVWDELIPSEMALAISGRYSPLIWRRNLIYYNPMLVTSSPDIIGARTQIVTGCKSVSHPPVLFELGGTFT